MNMLFSQDFGPLGIALTIFVVGFAIVMPLGAIYFAKKLSAQAQEQDRHNAEMHKHA